MWRAEAGGSAVVVRISPAWRTVKEIIWTHEVARFAAQGVDEVVAPLAARDGTMAFLWAGRPAAQLPARLHTALHGWPGHTPRPRGTSASRRHRRAPGDPSELVDPSLDRWRTEWVRAGEQSAATRPIRGDYYRGNLLGREGRVVGLIDWDDARLAPQFEEGAWATWESAKVADGELLDVDRARAFLEDYASAGGLLPPDLDRSLAPLIRWRLREEIRRARSAAAREIVQTAEDEAYVARQVRAFGRIRDLSVPLAH